MSDTSSFITVYTDATLPNSRTLAVGEGLALTIGGALGDVTVSPGGRLTALAEMDTSGFIAYNTGTRTYAARQFVGGTGITVTPTNSSGNVTVAQIPGTVVQKINVADSADSIISVSGTLKLIGGDDIDIAIETDGGTGAAAVTISSTSPVGTVTSVNCTSSNAFISVSGVPITSSGTIALTVGTLSIAKGGTGGTTRSTSFNALSPITNAGDIIIGTDTDTSVRLAAGTANQVLQINSGTGLPNWSSGPGTGSVTSINNSSSTGLLVTGGPVTGSGTIAIDLPGSGVDSAVEEGDLLVGTTGTYAAVAIGTTGKVWTSNGTTASWETSVVDLATFICQTGDNLPTNGINLNDPEVVMVVGSDNSASLPPDIFSGAGTGTLTVYNNWASYDSPAANMLVACADTSAFVSSIPPNVSFYGYKGSNATPSLSINGYASRGTSALGGVALLDGDSMVEIVAYGKFLDGTGNFANAAAITLEANDDFTASDSHPTVMRFKTSDYGDEVALNRMQVNSDGTVTCFHKLFATELELTSSPLPIDSGGTGQSTAGSAFNSLAPTNITGDMIYYTAGSNERLPAFNSGQQYGFLRSQAGALAYGAPYAATGTETALVGTRAVAVTDLTTNAVITLTIIDAVGGPTIAPAVYVSSVSASSFDMTTIGVGGGGGKATTIDVRWVVHQY